MVFQIKLGDVLFQENKIIGFLKEINVDDNIMGFVPAHSVVLLENNQAEAQEVGYMEGEWMSGTSTESSSTPASSPSPSPPSSPCSVADPFSHNISPR